VADVTVVIPMYNAAATIGRALDSVLAQTGRPAKIVVCNDCSTDDSAEIVRTKYADTVVLVTTDKNGGVAVARNRGAREATTEWLAFVDADDWWQPEFLEKTLAAVAQIGADFGSAGGSRERPDGGGKHVQVRLLPGRDEVLDLTREFWSISRTFRPMVTYGALMKRSLFESIGGFPENMRTGEDACMWIELWLRGKFAFVNLPLVESEVTTGSITAHRLPYHAIVLNMRCIYGGLWRAMLRRKPGTLGFLGYAINRTIKMHSRWLLHRRRAQHPTA
jgi:glycosyltransferase involved in cell wall biosynthesis